MQIQGQIQSLTLGGLNPELGFRGHSCLFHVKSFLALLFAIENIVLWGTMAPQPPGSTHVQILFRLICMS